MAVYRIFSDYDTFISTLYPTANNGLDEMIEVGGFPFEGSPHTHRGLITFPTSEIRTLVNNTIGNTNFSASLNLKLATAYELPTTYSLECYPVYESWQNGTGKFEDKATNKTGASWYYRKANRVDRWNINTETLPSGSTFRTGSIFLGGGNWYTASNGIDLAVIQSHDINSSHDALFNVTNAVKLHYSGSISNNGFIIKLENGLEFSQTASVLLQYFSRDTHTLYPPYLDVKWNDFTYTTGSNTTVSVTNPIVNVKNNRGTYPDIGKQRFRISARDRYPTRTFTTSSIYLTEKYLPKASYWGLRDEYTEEMVIPFDTTYTQISGDSEGNYFDIYMNGLQPERYYRILIKTTLDSSTTILSDTNIFKVIRHG